MSCSAGTLVRQSEVPKSLEFMALTQIFYTWPCVLKKKQTGKNEALGGMRDIVPNNEQQMSFRGPERV